MARLPWRLSKGLGGWSCGSVILRQYIKTGGSGIGKTTISNSEIATKGTSVKVTGAAKITMTGNASMKQT